MKDELNWMAEMLAPVSYCGGGSDSGSDSDNESETDDGRTLGEIAGHVGSQLADDTSVSLGSKGFSVTVDTQCGSCHDPITGSNNN